MPCMLLVNTVLCVHSVYVHVASTVNVLSLNYVQYLRMYVYYTVCVMHTDNNVLYIIQCTLTCILYIQTYSYYIPLYPGYLILDVVFAMSPPTTT